VSRIRPDFVEAFMGGFEGEGVWEEDQLCLREALEVTAKLTFFHGRKGI
jgi:hypothetical protein